MNCYIFYVHIDCCFSHDNSRYDPLELGPLNMEPCQTIRDYKEPYMTIIAILKGPYWTLQAEMVDISE